MKQPLNPLHHGHMCFRTDDIEAFKKRLEEMNVPYADYGVWAMANWYQIFFQDPDGNIIEVHQPINDK
jgi:catechol 2,3-dioxygenase-like lactoylglutathione lyase family enzyme